MPVCGYVILPTQWFEGDPPGPTRSFTLYCDEEGGVVFNKELRDYWVECVQPLYHIGTDDHICLFLHLKSNPRRIHPHAQAFCSWYLDEVPEYIRSGHGNFPPILVMRATTTPKPAYWRDGLAASLFLSTMRSKEAYVYLLRLQAWFRKTIAKKTTI